MSAKTFLVVLVVVLLLTVSMSSAVAAAPIPSTALPTESVSWSVSGSNLSIFPLGRIQPNGECESGGNCSG